MRAGVSYLYMRELPLKTWCTVQYVQDKCVFLSVMAFYLVYIILFSSFLFLLHLYVTGLSAWMCCSNLKLLLHLSMICQDHCIYVNALSSFLNGFKVELTSYMFAGTPYFTVIRHIQLVLVLLLRGWPACKSIQPCVCE